MNLIAHLSEKMPLRVTKKTPPGPGSKRAARGRAAASANQVQSESKVKLQDIEVKEEFRAVDVEKDMEHAEKESIAAPAYGNTFAKSKRRSFQICIFCNLFC